MIALFTASKWGWNNSSITYKMKLYVTKAACCQVAHDYGFKCTFTTSQFPALGGGLMLLLKGTLFYVRLTHVPLLILKVKSMLTTLNICIRINSGTIS